MPAGNLQTSTNSARVEQPSQNIGAYVENANIDFIEIYKFEASKILGSSLDAMEKACIDLLQCHPQINLGEKPSWIDEEPAENLVISSLIDEDEETYEQVVKDKSMRDDEFDLFEAPEYEMDFESGENEYPELYGETGTSQSFIDYAWNRYFADFKGEDDETCIIVENFLKECKHPYFSLNCIPELKGMNSRLQKWFEDLQIDFGALKNEALEYHCQSAIPDIIFRVNDNDELTYEINMGIFDTFVIPENVIGKISFTEGKGVPIKLLKSILMKRKAFLSLLAEYLIKTQSEFISARYLPEGLRKIKSIQQNDFLEYLKKLGIKEAEDTIEDKPDGNKKTNKQKDLVSRIFKDKYIELPLCNTVLHARICLDRPVRNLNRITSAQEVLEKAFSILISQHSEKMLTSSAQAEIIQGVLGIPYSSGQVSRTLWKHLRKKYDEADWTKLRIIGEGREKLNIPDSDKLDSESVKNIIEAIKAEMELH